MASRTIPARFLSLLCLLAILLVAIPCASAAPHHAMPTATCDTCCPTQFTSSPACCTAAPQPAAVVPQPFSAAFTLDHQRLPLPHHAIPATPVILLTKIRNTSPPTLRTILRI